MSDPAQLDEARVDLGTDRLRFDRRGPVGWCTVDNPARRNALTRAMYRGLGAAVRAVAASPVLDALVITGVDDVFIVGGDMADDDDAPLRDDDLPFQTLHRGEVPTVVAINGHCQASGVLLAALADVAVASETAIFRLPELRRGVAAPWSSQMLHAFVGMARARDLALTSRSFDAAEAQQMGLISRVVPPEELVAEAQAVALDLLEAAPEARRSWKRAMHSHIAPVIEDEVEASYRTPEAQEGFASFVERRPPTWSPRATGRDADRRVGA